MRYLKIGKEEKHGKSFSEYSEIKMGSVFPSSETLFMSVSFDQLKTMEVELFWCENIEFSFVGAE